MSNGNKESATTGFGRVLFVVFLSMLVSCAAGVTIGAWLWRVDRVHDPRAYSVDSGELTLDRALRRSGISVPECMQNGLRYALIDDGFGYYYNVYLKAIAPKTCMDDLLASNAMRDYMNQLGKVADVQAESRPGHRPRWMNQYPVPQIGWEIGPQQRFQEFGVFSSTSYTVTVLIQHVPNSRMLQAYLYAFRGG